VVAWLPESLPKRDAIVWTKRTSAASLGGVAATDDCVIISDRDPADRVDIFRCLNADGSERWTLRYPAPGNLDFGNSSRATPLIDGEFVFLSGAHGDFHAVDLATGKVRWKKHFQRDFGGPKDLSWGFCSSPLIAEGRLIVQPGGPKASLVALKAETGEVVWTSPGRPPGHSSAVVATIRGVKQVITYDNESLGGWNLTSGERLWTVRPRVKGDFNVATPIVWNEQLFVATENNGARIYRFNNHGLIDSEPIAENHSVVPDCATPILVANRLFGVSGELFCLDAQSKLAEIWRSDHECFRGYTTLIASDERFLAISLKGKLLLANVAGKEFKKLGELQLIEGEEGLYSHSAVVGGRLYVRGSKMLVCFDLNPRLK
jgi:outer membrane protein assembly factor BamB